MSVEERIRLLEVWLNHFKIHKPTLSKNDRMAFLERFRAMGREIEADMSKVKGGKNVEKHYYRTH